MVAQNKRPSLKRQWNSLVQEAHRRGLCVRRADGILRKTKYRAMNPRAARLLRQSCPPKTIIYALSSRRSVHRKVMDVRHEIIEHDKLRELSRRGIRLDRRYPLAHQYANRKQNTADAIE